MRRIGYGGFVLVSFCYLVLRRLLQLAALRVQSKDFKELEIVVLRHELAILCQARTRPVLTTVDRLFLAAASRFLAPRAAQPGRSSGRFAARWPCSRPVDWPTSMR
jgi:hypothetical protein